MMRPYDEHFHRYDSSNDGHSNVFTDCGRNIGALKDKIVCSMYIRTS